MKSFSRLLGTVCLSLILSSFVHSVNATVVQYTDRAAWSSSVGAITGSEDFNTYTSDTQFRTQTISLNGMTLSASGVSQHHGTLANKIDVATFEFSGVFAIDSTPYLLADIELEESGGSFIPINLRFDFDDPLSAWGADLMSFPTAAIVLVEIYGSTPASPPLASFPYIPSGSTSEIDFFGFQVTDEVFADHIIFSIGSASGFETFGLDNIDYVSGVPIPGAIWLFSTGLLGLIGVSRRMK